MVFCESEFSMSQQTVIFGFLRFKNISTSLGDELLCYYWLMSNVKIEIDRLSVWELCVKARCDRYQSESKPVIHMCWLWWSQTGEDPFDRNEILTKHLKSVVLEWLSDLWLILFTVTLGTSTQTTLTFFQIVAKERESEQNRRSMNE